jgi:hypothetical protein
MASSVMEKRIIATKEPGAVGAGVEWTTSCWFCSFMLKSTALAKETKPRGSLARTEKPPGQ